jgi:hypothetical protein
MHALIGKSNRHGKSPASKTPKHREGKILPEPREWERSSFTGNELSICKIILTSLSELPVCKCENPEKKVRVEIIDSGFRASCAWCGFEVFSSGSKWPAEVETVKLEHRRLVMN